MVYLGYETSLGDVNIADLILVPYPEIPSERTLALVLADPRICREHVPYILLESRRRGHAYFSPHTMPVTKVENGHKIPPIRLLLFNYGEVGGSPKYLLENEKTRHSEEVSNSDKVNGAHQLLLL